MGSAERAGCKDFGQVELIDVTPEAPPVTVPLPTPVLDPTPVHAAHHATIEQTGADPPPVQES